jgi:hypothetical protein
MSQSPDVVLNLELWTDTSVHADMLSSSEFHVPPDKWVLLSQIVNHRGLSWQLAMAEMLDMYISSSKSLEG